MAITTLITLTLFMVVSYAANLGCNGVEYEISGNSYFEPVNACVNKVVYFCDGNVLKRKPCTLAVSSSGNVRTSIDFGAFTSDDSAITSDVCSAITTEKNATACQTYCDGELCPAVIETAYPLIPWGDPCGGAQQCITDSSKLCQFYWQVEQTVYDLRNGAAAQTAVHMTDRCIDSSIMYSCVHTVWSTITSYVAYKTEYAQPDCTGNSTTTRILTKCPYIDDTSSTPPTEPISYGCYVDRTASPTIFSTASPTAPVPTTSPVTEPTASPSDVPTASPVTDTPTISPVTGAPTVPSAEPTEKPTAGPTSVTGEPSTSPTTRTTEGDDDDDDVQGGSGAYGVKVSSFITLFVASLYFMTN